MLPLFIFAYLNNVGLVPSYDGPNFSLDDLEVRRSDSGGAGIDLPSFDDPLKNLERGTYQRKIVRWDQERCCSYKVKFYTCSVEKKEESLKKPEYSYFLCQGCPLCHPKSPCFVKPCNSVTTARPHQHTGRAVFFPEKDSCPFIKKRRTPMLLNPERTRMVENNGCSQYQSDKKYFLVERSSLGNVDYYVYGCRVYNGCQPYEEACSKVFERCKVFEKERCVEWECKYLCEAREERVHKVPGFCLPEINPPQEERQIPGDFAKAVGLLGAVMKEVKTQENVEEIKVFKGFKGRCSVDVLGFRDCCLNMSGWGRTLGFWCKDYERYLAHMREQKRCVCVGLRRSSVLGAKTRSEQVYCCYGSALIRVIQEFAHHERMISWGSAESPNCEGLSLQELKMLNFDNISAKDISEALNVNGRSLDYEKIKTQIHDCVRRFDRSS